MNRRSKSKTLLLSWKQEIDQEDAGINFNSTDRIPSVLNVTAFDICCFGFAMFSYMLDFFSDIAISFFHFYHNRFVEGSLVLFFSLGPSIIINSIAFHWMMNKEFNTKIDAGNSEIIIDQNNRKLRTPNFFSTSLRSILCLCQMGPCYFYFKAYQYGSLFRSSSDDIKKKRILFSKMVEAEKDATLLRCFEAFLESSPQLIIQGVILARFFLHSSSEIPIWIFYQCISLIISTFSVSWSLVVHNRTLRMVSDDKINLWPKEIVLQVFWRFLNVSSRFSVVFLCVVFFKYQILYFATVHFILSTIHVVVLQAFHMEVETKIEILLIILNVFIHFFTPFNMAEGRTRYRYLTAYSIEFLELAAAIILLPNVSANLHWVSEIKIFSAITFSMGIFVMCLYYLFFHPNHRHNLLQTDVENIALTSDQSVSKPMENEKCEKSCEALNP